MIKNLKFLLFCFVLFLAACAPPQTAVEPTEPPATEAVPTDAPVLTEIPATSLPSSNTSWATRHLPS